MKVQEFSNQADFVSKQEIEKVELLAFFLAENKQEQEFTISDISSIIFALGFAKPNQTRLKGKVEKSNSFVKGSKKNQFRLSVKKMAGFKAAYPDISESEEVVSDDSILPEILLQETNRPYLIKLAK